MILGAGIDLIEVSRIAKSIENESFKIKVFSEAEIAYCETKANKEESYAVRFAAKEAFLKAVGTGLRSGMAINEIEVFSDELGKPFINLIGKTAETLADKKIKTIHVSLSHIKEMAIAMIVLES